MTALCLKRPITCLMVFLALAGLGLFSLKRMSISFMPDMDFKQITVTVPVRGGMGPQEIERLVTIPVEDALSGVNGLDTLFSLVEEGLSRCSLKFHPQTDTDQALMDVREALAKVKGHLPQEADEITVARYAQNDAPILILFVSHPQKTVRQLRAHIEAQIKPVLLKQDGVAEVEVVGGVDARVVINLDPDRLRHYRLNFHEVLRILRMNNQDRPLGTMEQQGTTLRLRSLGRFKRVEDLQEFVVLTDQGQHIRLKDIATLSHDDEPARSQARINGQEGVSLYLKKESTSNTIELSRRIHYLVQQQFQPQLAQANFVILKDQAQDITASIGQMLNALWMGAVLAVGILFVFLGHWQAAVSVILCLPLVLLGCFWLMDLAGLSFNVMTLSGLALGIGLLVDNAIVVTESIFEHHDRGDKQAIEHGANRVMWPLLASTLTSVIVFLPLFFLSYEVRLQFVPLSLSIIFSLCLSWMVSFSFLPVLLKGLLRLSAGAVGQASGRLQRWVDQGLSGLLHQVKRRLIWSLRYPGLLLRVCAVVVGLLLCSIFIYPGVQGDLNTQLQKNSLNIAINPEPGLKLSAALQVVRKVEAVVAQSSHVQSYLSRVQRGSSYVEVTLHKNADLDALMKAWNQEFEPLQHEAFIFIQEGSASQKSGIALEVIGPDYDQLQSVAQRVAQQVSQIKGLQDIRMEVREGQPEFVLQLDSLRCAPYGLTVDDVAQFVHGAMRGFRVAYDQKRQKRKGHHPRQT